jgi:g-D-glutamyl-meso-diaminopimelate peptidase
MQLNSTKLVLFVVGIVVVVLGVFLYFKLNKKPEPVAKAPEIVKIENPVKTIIGKSVEGRNIEAYTFGNGKNHIEFVGGIHGGYEWNSSVLAYEVLEYLKANPNTVPENTTVTVIPALNPDGIYKIVGKVGRFYASDVPKNIVTDPGRFNANKVDLNRNFDCKWNSKSTWKNTIVSGGTSAFSEPESKAFKSFVEKDKPLAVVFWHSQSGAVYASRCDGKTLPETLKIMNLYATSSKYTAVETFDAYATTGDSEGWLAKINIPAITVELTTHDDVEFQKNLDGVKALLEYYK